MSFKKWFKQKLCPHNNITTKTTMTPNSFSAVTACDNCDKNLPVPEYILERCEKTLFDNQYYESLKKLGTPLEDLKKTGKVLSQDQMDEVHAYLNNKYGTNIGNK